MHEIVTGFLAALHHDGKKLLLNTKRADERNYASWGTSLYDGSHEFWDTLEDQGDPADLAPWHQQAVPLPPDVVTLIKLQGGWAAKQLGAASRKDPRPTAAQVNALSPRLAISLRAADAIHKALYQGDDSQVGEIHVARQFPFSYPFYGPPIVWTPELTYVPPHVTPEALPRPPFEALNPREQFKALLDGLDGLVDGRLKMADLLKLQRTALRAFPDSTYLPLTSLGFHQRLVAALFLLVYRELEGYCFGPEPAPLRPVFYLNTVVSPPERLTNRLRDTAVVRKISHRLQHAFHAYLSDTYLTELGALGLRHPDNNPLFFYNKDATVLFNRAADQGSIESICHDVAQTTESVITLMSLRIDAEVPLALHNPASYSVPIALPAVQVTDVSMGIARACPREPVRRTVGPTIGTIVPLQTGDEIAACAACNKPAPQGQLHKDPRGDALCALCLELREGYPYCTQCHLYVLPPGHACAYCGATSAQKKLKPGYPSPKVLQGGRDTGEGHRVAYVALYVQAAYNTIRAEAEVLMAHFRQDRAAFERGTAHQQVALRWNLARTRPSQSGIFEYLQAAQDMARFQLDLEEALKASWKEAADLAPRRAPRDQYYIDQAADLAPAHVDSLLGASFLYRSPTLTLVVMPEQVLPAFYRRFTPLTRDLQLAHTVRIVTCRYNQPVWMALRALGLSETSTLPDAPGLEQALQRLSIAQKALDAQRAQDTKALEQVRSQLHTIIGHIQTKMTKVPQDIQEIEKAISNKDEFIRSALFLVIGDTPARVLPSAIQRLPQRQRQSLPGVLADLGAMQDRARAQAEAVWQAGDAVLALAQTVHARLRADQVLTVLRSGVHRTFRGAAVLTFLLDQVVQSPAYAGSQLGELATYTQTVLAQVQALPEADRARAFWDNLQLELDARGSSRGRDTSRGDAGLPPAVISLLQEAFRLPGLTPDQVPGLLLEMAVRQKDQSAVPHSERRPRSHV